MDVISKNVLHNSIINKQYNLSRLLCIIYDSQYQNDDEFQKLSKIILEREKIIDNPIINKHNLIVEELPITSVTENTSLIRLFISCNWCSSEQLCELWNKMSKGNCKWNNIQLVSEEPCDYYCIINQTNVEFIPSKTILFRMEPNIDLHPEKWGEKWSKLNKDDYLFCGTHDLHINNIEWHLSTSYTDLMSMEIEKKYDILSAVLSDKYSDSGHIKRVDFVKFLERKGLQVDVYGGNRFLWKNYKGELPYHKKDDALYPYKYTFNCENASLKNYCTEKLYDGILAECLVFYSGCINVKDFVDEKAFVYLELSNFEKDYETITKAIKENWWEQRLPYIKKAKDKILNEMQFFPRIEKIIGMTVSEE